MARRGLGSQGWRFWRWHVHTWVVHCGDGEWCPVEVCTVCDWSRPRRNW